MGAYKVRKTVSSRLRDTLDYPVIDTDGHIMEQPFVLEDFLKQVGGPTLVERFKKSVRIGTMGGDQPKSVPWPQFSGPYTIDRATTMLPRLYAMRLEEAGCDFTTLYPTLGFRIQVHPDDEVRAGACRALNMMYAELFAEVKDKMTPAALIPMNTPEEAIGELEFAVKQLGLKAIMTCNEVARTPKIVAEKAPELSGQVREYSPLAIDSPYDYDLFWAKCQELKVCPSGHSMNFIGTHQSPRNYIYNRVGFFATYGHAAARALFLSGVTQRFPGLNFAFMEGGAWWGVALFNDLVEIWEKRNMKAIMKYHDQAAIDVPLMEEMARLYGNKHLTPERIGPAMQALAKAGRTPDGRVPDFVDDWKTVKIDKREDIRDSFVNQYYFGCEADDALNYTAFNAKANKMGVKLKAMFSSDLAHWDVVDFGDVLHEAHEQVEEGLISDEDFKDFVFTNPLTFQTRVNPNFFQGTAVEGAVASYLRAAAE